VFLICEQRQFATKPEKPSAGFMEWHAVDIYSYIICYIFFDQILLTETVARVIVVAYLYMTHGPDPSVISFYGGEK